MKNDAPALLPVFRSQTQAEMLTAILLHPNSEYTLTELAAQAKVSVASAYHEVSRLVESSLLLDRIRGRTRLVKANPRHRAIGPLTKLVEVTYGPKVLVAEAFGRLGVNKVVMFGTWAARYSGVAGDEPRDIDVLVVGKAARIQVNEAADRVRTRLKIPVNPVLRSLQQWESGEDELIAQIKASWYVTLLERD